MSDMEVGPALRTFHAGQFAATHRAQADRVRCVRLGIAVAETDRTLFLARSERVVG
jgi:hypothetical protein